MNNKNDIKTNNKGISLIEIIIVIAIMVILGGVFFLSTAVATNKQVNSCANKVASSLESARSLAIGKKGAYIAIWQDVGDYVKCQIYVDGEAPGGTAYGDEIAIGHPGLTVTVYTSTGSYTLAGHATKTFVSFSRSNGSVNDSIYVKSIEVKNGSRSITVEIDKFTGRVSVGGIVDI